MLSALKVKNLRCFADSGRLEFGKLNILIGPNNAGKSALLSAVELLLQNSLAVHGGAPLSFAGQPQFSAFSSTLRRQWGPHEQRPSQIVLDAEWGSVDDAEEALRWWTTFRLSGSESDDETFVSEADYGLLDGSKRRSNPEVSVSRRTIGRGMS